ncbi:MAG: hypothetical protein Dbin4_02317 [Alphaproteobacteria bacterium]|nr:hypothetical protein [Alphaproteobacteria bacterium]
MRGEDRSNGPLFSYIDMERRIHAKHQLRLIRGVVNAAVKLLRACYRASACAAAFEQGAFFRGRHID